MRIPDLRVLTSRLRRTIATARGVEAPQEHVAALNELHAGVCEGLSYEEMQEQYPQVIHRSIFDNPHFSLRFPKHKHRHRPTINERVYLYHPISTKKTTKLPSTVATLQNYTVYLIALRNR